MKAYIEEEKVNGPIKRIGMKNKRKELIKKYGKHATFTVKGDEGDIRKEIKELYLPCN